MDELRSGQTEFEIARDLVTLMKQMRGTDSPVVITINRTGGSHCSIASSCDLPCGPSEAAKAMRDGYDSVFSAPKVDIHNKDRISYEEFREYCRSVGRKLTEGLTKPKGETVVAAKKVRAVGSAPGYAITAKEARAILKVLEQLDSLVEDGLSIEGDFTVKCEGDTLGRVRMADPEGRWVYEPLASAPEEGRLT